MILPLSEAIVPLEKLTPTLKQHLKMLKQLDFNMILIISRKNEIKNMIRTLKKKNI
jgi:hypothetical protein